MPGDQEQITYGQPGYQTLEDEIAARQEAREYFRRRILPSSTVGAYHAKQTHQPYAPQDPAPALVRNYAGKTASPDDQ